MLELFLLYKWVIVAGSLVAATLALLGCHLAARDKAMQTLCVGQGATLGVLVGLATGSFPFLGACLFSIGTFAFSEWLVSRRQSSKNTYYTCLFASCLAAGSLLTALIPQLENHMTQVFFGDLATLTNRDAIFASLLGAGVLLYLTGFWRRVAGESFSEAIFGRATSFGLGTGFSVVTLITLSFSVQFLGFLFTMACLFLPTAVLAMASLRGLMRHLFFSAALAATGTLTGFGVSLNYTRIPTVPAVVLSMLCLGLVAVATSRVATMRFR